MRRLALLLLGLVLLSLEGALARIFHLEILRPDLILILIVFLALRAGAAEGAVLVFLLGLLADSLGGLPPGISGLVGLAVWMLVRGSQRFLLWKRRGIQLGLVFVLSLVAGLLTAALMQLLDVGSGIFTLAAKYLLPLALLQMLLALPVWALASRVLGTGAQAPAAGTG